MPDIVISLNNDPAPRDESHAIRAAITRQTPLGHKVLVFSTPSGMDGKFYELYMEHHRKDMPNA
ncbi:MAG: hypothetical protein BGO25_05615 [Acidobacteriales bacterium 59-55]|nr:hypothetical protein [Terriglobales bacterium]OJV44560.1 MAG: hypothetical protein BGO25_05615 [Acidobacteriales bacterium 59-55]